MKSFDEGVAGLQVGIRKGLPARSGHLDGYPSEPSERTALVEIATMDLMIRAGAPTAAVESLPAAPPETLRVAHAAPIEEALGQEAVLLEWAATAAARGFVVPPSALPGFLHKLPSHPKQFAPLLGERGRWLATLMGVTLPAEETSPRAELGPEYDALDWKERITAIAALRNGLSPADEPLLLHALNDRRKEVRDEAADLIVRLPVSTPAQELRALAMQLVTVRRSLLRTSLDVMIPDSEIRPKWLPGTGARQGMGPGAIAIMDILRFVPPSSWGRPPAEMLALAGNSDYTEALVEGWSEASLRFDESEWIDALLRHAHSLPGRKGRFAERASETAFEAELIPRLRRSGAEAVYGLLVQRNRPFSAELSRAVVDAARRGEGTHYLLNDLGSYLHRSILPLLDAPWAEEGPWESLRLRWRAVLDLRARLQKSLE